MTTSTDPSTGPAPRKARSQGRLVAHQLAWVSSGRILAALLQALLFILAARHMTVAQFGSVTAFFGLVTLVQAVADSGVGTFISRERAAHPTSGGVASALRFTSVSAAAIVALTGGGLMIAALVASPIFWSMLPLAVAAGGERNADMRYAVAFADGDVQASVFNLTARRASAIAIFMGGVALGAPAVLSFSAASGIAAAGSAAFANVYIRRRVTTPSSLSFRELLARSRPYWVNTMASQARNLDAVLVASLAGAGAAGLYSSGSRLINPLQILPTSLASVLLPASARGQQSHRALVVLVKLSLLVVAALSLVYVVLFLAAGLLLDRALGSRYDGSATVLRIILVGLPFSTAASLCASILQGRGQGRSVAVAASVSTGFCLAGVAAAAPFAGARGAAVMLSLSFVVQLAGLARAFGQVWAEPDPVPDELSLAGRADGVLAE